MYCNGYMANQHLSNKFAPEKWLSLSLPWGAALQFRLADTMCTILASKREKLEQLFISVFIRFRVHSLFSFSLPASSLSLSQVFSIM